MLSIKYLVILKVKIVKRRAGLLQTEGKYVLILRVFCAFRSQLRDESRINKGRGQNL